MTWVSKNSVRRRPAALQIMGQAISPFITGQGALATAVRWQGRIPIIFGPWPVSEFRAQVRGWYLDSAYTKQPLPKDYSISMSLELLQGSLVTASAPILFGGTQAHTITAGDADTDGDDWCAVNGEIPGGAHGWLRYDATVGSAGMLAISGLIGTLPVSALGGSGAWFTTTGAATGNVNATGAMSATGGTATVSGGAPICIAGMIGKYDYQRTAMFIIGNSRDAGAAAMQIACTDMGIPVINFGYFGSTTGQWGALPSAAYAQVAYCTDMYIGDCINDISGGQSLATVQAAYNNIISKAKAINPSVRIWGKKALPHTTTTDAYATPANQAGTTGCVWPGSIRDLYNAWLDTLVGTLLYAVLDPCAALEYGGSGASGKWVPLSTTDGLHEIAANYMSEAVLFRSQFLALGGIPNTGAF